MQSSILNYVTSDKLPMFRKPQYTKQNEKRMVEYKLPTREYDSVVDFVQGTQQTLDTRLAKKRNGKWK